MRVPKGPAGEEWLSVQAACDYVHVSCTTMYRLVREGKLPSRRELGPNSNTVNMRVAKRRHELSGEPDPKAGGAELREVRKRIREPEAENALPKKPPPSSPKTRRDRALPPDGGGEGGFPLRRRWRACSA